LKYYNNEKRNPLSLVKGVGGFFHLCGYGLLKGEFCAKMTVKGVRYHGQKIKGVFRHICYKLSRISYTKLEITNEVLKVANQIISMGILTPKSFDDCQHIATAVVHGCDGIISWNFKHIVNVKTIRGMRAITNLEGYKQIEILSPSALLESEG